MADRSEPPPAASHRASTGADPRLQTFGYLGGAAAWAAHLTIGYALFEIDCGSERFAFEAFGVPGLHLLGFLLTAVAGVTALAAAVVAHRSHPRYGSGAPLDPADAHESEGRSRFLARTGTILSGLFVLAILTGGASFFVLGRCA